MFVVFEGGGGGRGLPPKPGQCAPVFTASEALESMYRFRLERSLVVP